MSDPILIVGGGLAGLIAARRLHHAGVTFRLLEARERLGGRVLSVDAGGTVATDGFDLGPSWFWPGTQPALHALVRELGLTAFPQKTARAKSSSTGCRARSRSAIAYPRSRCPSPCGLAGGSGALISGLAADLLGDSIRLGARVTHVSRHAGEGSAEVRFTMASGSDETMRASHILFALPPRLLEATVTFSSDARCGHRGTLARHADRDGAGTQRSSRSMTSPSGARPVSPARRQSMAGPLVEIHDATTVSGQAALFGFFGVPASNARSSARRCSSPPPSSNSVRYSARRPPRRAHALQGLGRATL